MGMVDSTHLTYQEDDTMLVWMGFGISGLVGLNVLALALCKAADHGDRLERAAFDAASRQRRSAQQRKPGTAA
jgi:hypothetical protein